MKTINDLKDDAIKVVYRYCNEYFTLETDKKNAVSAFNAFGTVVDETDANAVITAKKVCNNKEKAVLAFDKFKRNLEFNMMQEINAIKLKMHDAIVDAFSYRAENVDASTVKLFQSGILEPSEYEIYMRKAKAEKNGTMARVVAQYATDAGKSIKSADIAKAMRYLAVASEYDIAEEYLEKLSDFVAIIGSISRNPSLMKNYNVRYMLDNVSF